MSIVSSTLQNIQNPPKKGNITDFALEKATEYGRRSALIDGISGNGLSYTELKREVLKLALALTRRGIKKGHVVSVIPERCVQTVVIYYGIMYIGAIVHPMNHLLKSDELKAMIFDAKPVLVFACATALPETEKTLEGSQENVPAIIVIGESSEYDTYTSLMEGVLEEDLCQVAPVDLDIYDSPACVLYTSGTTGVPKGVLMSHASLIINSFMLTSDPSVALVESDSDVILLIVYMVHAVMFVVLSYAFRHGATLVIGPGLSSCTPRELVHIMDRYKANTIVSPPSNVQAFIKSPESVKHSLPTLRTWLTAGAPVKEHIYSIVAEKFKFKVTQLYGMTELLALISKQHPKDGSAGLLLPGIQAKVKEVATGTLLLAHQKGELCFKTPSVMLGYLNKPDEARQSLDEDGFFSTGDVGYFDEEENFYIVDRIKFIIKREGMLVSPSELENLLISHPAIHDVAVVGLPQENGEDLVQAWVVKQDGQDVSKDDLCQYVADRRIWYKHLTGGVVFTDSIPRTGLGKILYHRLSEKSALH